MSNSLFGDDLSCQGYVESKLRPHFPLLWQVVTKPFVAYRKRIAGNDRDFLHLPNEAVAQWLHYQMIEQACRTFKKVPGVRICHKKYGTTQMFAIVFGEEIVVALKKLDERDLCRSNYRTRNQREYWRKGRTLFDPDLHVLWGYKFVEANTAIKLYLTYPTGDYGNAWSIAIPDQSAAIAVDAEQRRQERERKGFRVNVKRRKDALGGSDPAESAG